MVVPLVAEDKGGNEREREWESVKAAAKWHGISDIHGSTLAGNLGSHLEFVP